MEAVARLEAEAFSTPWSAATFRNLMRQGGPELLVLELPGVPVAGYAVLWCLGEQGELANIAVASHWRGRGFGSTLLAGVLKAARARGVKEVFLEVRASNEAAIKMYERHGFERISRRIGYYDRPREDALVMRSRLRLSAGAAGAEDPNNNG